MNMSQVTLHFKRTKVTINDVFISSSPAPCPTNSCFQINITRLKFPFASECWALSDSEAYVNSVYSEIYNTSYSTLVSNSSHKWSLYQYNPFPSIWIDFSYEGKTIMKPPYLYNGDFHTDKTVPFTEFSWFIPRTNWPPYYRTQFQLYFIWNLYPFLSLLLLFCIIWKSLNVVLIIRLPIS